MILTMVSVGRCTGSDAKLELGRTIVYTSNTSAEMDELEGF